MKKLLLIDDNAMDRRLIRMALEKKDSELMIFEAASGKAGLETLEGLWPILTVLDVRMPGIDGFQVLAIIKQTEHQKDMPVIMMSGSDDSFDEQQAMVLGADAYFTKPDNLLGYSKLVDVVHHQWLKCPKPERLYDDFYSAH